MITDKTIETIQDSVKTEVIEVGGKLYTTRQVFETSKPEPEVTPLTVHTLTGLAGWVNGEFDNDDEGEDVAIHVESHSRVSVIGEIRGQVTGVRRDRAWAKSAMVLAFQAAGRCSVCIRISEHAAYVLVM